MWDFSWKHFTPRAYLWVEAEISNKIYEFPSCILPAYKTHILLSQVNRLNTFSFVYVVPDFCPVPRIFVMLRWTIFAMHFKDFIISSRLLPSSMLAIWSVGLTDSGLPYSNISLLEQERQGEWDIQMVLGFWILWFQRVCDRHDSGHYYVSPWFMVRYFFARRFGIIDNWIDDPVQVTQHHWFHLCCVGSPGYWFKSCWKTDCWRNNARQCHCDIYYVIVPCTSLLVCRVC